MIYILICQVGEIKSMKTPMHVTPMGVYFNILYGNGVRSICKACDVHISEMVNFLSADRVHMQQGIFPEIQQDNLLHSCLDFDEVSCKALIGAPLKQAELLSIDQTSLAKIVAEESGNDLKMDGLVRPVDEGKKEGEGESNGGEGSQVTPGGATGVTQECPGSTSKVSLNNAACHI